MRARVSLLCLFALTIGRQGAAAAQVPLVTEQQVDGVFVIDGVLTLPPPITEAQAWSVLADYGHLASFVSSIRKSEIQERTAHGARVEQVAEGKWFLFSRSATVLLDIREVPNRSITFHDLSHQDFALYDGSWTLTRVNGEVRVEYRLKAQPSASLPAFVIDKVFKSDASSLLEQVRTEIIRRATNNP